MIIASCVDVSYSSRFPLPFFFSIAQDYVEACDRLLQLKIGDQQRAEIVRVILHCCSRVS